MYFFKTTFATCLLLLLSEHTLQAQFTVPDPALVNKLQFFVPNAMTGSVLDTNHVDVLSLTVLPICCAGITDLSGVEFFTGLEELRANNNAITTLNALPPNLEILNLRVNQLTSLPSLPNTLKELVCSVNALTSLPALPASLEELDCTSNQIGSIPTLPPGLQSLYCSINPLYSLPTLPASLTRLGCVADSLSALPTLPPGLFSMDCSSNQLTSLPPFPSTLHYVVCTRNDLSVLPPLSNGMRSLDCRYNPALTVSTIPDSLRVFWCDEINISALPPLPNGLESLSCKNLGLTALPNLPDSLRTLYCEDNLLTVLPALPTFLDRLHCDDNLLTNLPSIPSTMEQMTCNNNSLSCLPTLPNGLNRLKCTGNPLSCLPNIPLNLDTAWSELGFPLVVCNVNTAPCPIMQETITGTVFNDTNGNGMMDAGEPPFMSTVIEATPGNYLTASGANGEYVLPITDGTFTVDGEDVLYHTRTTAPMSVTLGVMQTDSLNDIGYQAIPGVYDLVVEFHSSPARPGFDNNMYLEVRNIGTETTSAAIDLQFDAVQTWINSTEVPATLTATDATWAPVMMPGDVWNATVTMNTPVGIALGTPLNLTLSAMPAVPDTTPADNSVTLADVVVGSYDPNDKKATPEVMTPGQVQNGEFIEYTIRFQNTGTYPAVRVVITDTLSSDLLWNTMEYINSSHSNSWYMNDGVLHFIFDPIFLPDSVSDEPNSHGFVKFRMKPISLLMNGDQIENIANIYFDFNDPVITDPALFEVDVTSGIGMIEDNGFRVYPSPANDLLFVELEETDAIISVHSLEGRQVLEERATGAQTTLAVDVLVSGIYLISITGADGKQMTTRFVKR